MEMTEQDILRDYRQAASKSYQITVLADMNVCSVAEIGKILIDNNAEITQEVMKLLKRKSSQPKEKTIKLDLDKVKIICSKGEVKRQLMLRTYTKWTPERLERLRILFEQGLTFREIGKQLGVSTNAAAGAARKYLVPCGYGIYKPKKRGRPRKE